MSLPLDYYIFSSLWNLVASSVIALLVLLKHPWSRANRLFAMFASLVAFWSWFYFLWLRASTPSLAEYYVRTCMIGVVFMPSVFLHFVISLLEPMRDRRTIHLLNYLISTIISATVYSSLFASGVSQHLVFSHWPIPGPLFPVHLLHFGVIVAYAHYLMFRRLKSTQDLVLKNQVLYLSIGTGIGFVSGITNYFSWYRIPIPPLLNPCISLYVILIAIAIVRYRLMQINLVITRTAVFTIVYAFLLGLPLVAALIWQQQLEAQLGYRWWVWVWLAGAILATAAHYVNFYFQRQAEARLLRAQRRYQATLLQASQGMTQIRHLNKLLSLIVHVMTRTVGLTHAMVYLYDSKEDAFTLQSFRYARLVPEQERLAKDEPLITALSKTREAIVLEEVKAQVGPSSTKDPESWEKSRLCAQMERLHGAVMVPSFIEERLIGFLVLGEKRKGQIFTTEDLIVFSTLANQAAVAIENARFYEGERDRQAALFHAATLASLGTMASSMGHQVNNRFNVVALISSSQKMKLKGLLGNGHDQEKLRKALTECLEQFESLEEEAIQGGQIVASIRKLARPSTEGHKPLALRAAIKAGMDVVQHKVRFDEFDVQLDIPEDLPMVQGDLSQLGECFLNFIDNAYDSMKTKEQLINEGKLQPRNGGRPYRGAILMHAWVKDPRTIQIVIADNGTGVHPEDLRKLFIPFYTTKATAEKGTGLGLYVIKQIIEAHRGTIQAKSTYGEGMIFTLELPIAKLAPAEAEPAGKAP